jgi:hypothetical protein
MDEVLKVARPVGAPANTGPACFDNYENIAAICDNH